MGNKESAAQWLTKACHDLSSAQILHDADHYTDTIGYDLQQALEKTLKAFLAHDNAPIKKTHNLIDLYELVRKYIQFDRHEVRLLAIASAYYTQNRYPNPAQLPPRQQIKKSWTLPIRCLKKCVKSLKLIKIQ